MNLPNELKMGKRKGINVEDSEAMKYENLRVV
jgi:hypothetical protein